MLGIRVNDFCRFGKKSLTQRQSADFFTEIFTKTIETAGEMVKQRKLGVLCSFLLT